MFYDLLEGATYQGLNNTVGYAYDLALFNVFPGTLVIDSFTLLPAQFIAGLPINGTFTFIDATTMTKEESDHMLQVPPKGISCEEVRFNN